MTEHSSNTKSRKMASRVMLGTAILALPLPASVTYAESLVSAPVAPNPPPAPPAPPSPLAVVPPIAPVPPAVDPDTSESEIRDPQPEEKRVKTKRTKVKVIKRDEELSEEEIEEVLQEVREGLAQADEELREVRVELKEMFESEDWAALAGGPDRTFVRMSCDSGPKDVATTEKLKNGGTEVVI